MKSESKKNENPLFDLSKAKQKIENSKFANWWKRKGSKPKNFKYFNSLNERIEDEENLTRINSLVIPPAWKYVRISPRKGGKIQALGIDKSGRIQYIYHAKFTEKQKKKKFAKIERFGKFLPNLRKVTNEHIVLEGFPREKVLAVMIRLINSLYIRIGTEKSVKFYKTYGITTLQNRHLEIAKNGKLVFSFVGKHHIKHRKVIVDIELAKIMSDIKSIGKAGKLFHYLDAENKSRPIKPSEINSYLKLATSPEFSAKDFRTWGATLLAALKLAEIGPAAGETSQKKNIAKVIKKVAEQLGNTPSVCRSSYIHPVVLESYKKGILLEKVDFGKKRRISQIEKEYNPDEIALMNLFQGKTRNLSKIISY